MEVTGLHLQNIFPTLLPGLHSSYIQDSSILNYACIVWDPHHKKDQLLLEKVQLFAARVATKSWSQEQASLLTSLNLPSMMNRHSYLKLIFAFKFLNNLVFCPFVLFTYHPQPNLRINHNKQLLQPFARTVSFSSSYFISILLYCQTVELFTVRHCCMYKSRFF